MLTGAMSGPGLAMGLPGSLAATEETGQLGKEHFSIPFPERHWLCFQRPGEKKKSQALVSPKCTDPYRTCTDKGRGFVVTTQGSHQDAEPAVSVRWPWHRRTSSLSCFLLWMGVEVMGYRGRPTLSEDSSPGQLALI